MLKNIFFVFLLISNFSIAQVTIKLVSIPDNTPENAKLFIAGNFNNWSPNDTTYLLTKNYKGEYFIDLPIQAKNYEFKFTLGSWSSTEMKAGGGDLGNRILNARKDTLVTLSIQNWESLGDSPVGYSSSHAFLLSENFPMNDVTKTRRIWVYLPAEYYTQATKKFPVLYMQDGQNLFSTSTAANGEWEVDETLNELEKKGNFGVIVIGIENGGNERLNEYSPWKNPEYGGGKGKDYLDFVAYKLKPAIDLLYRTKPEREQTAIMGSSMGALITLYAAMKYESVFSKFGVFSPSLWFSDSIYRMPKQCSHYYFSNIYLMSGILESSTQAKETYAMRDSLLLNGFEKEEIRCEIKNDGTHSEWFWKREFAACVNWLFSAKDTSNRNTFKMDLTKKDFEIQFLPMDNVLLIRTAGLEGASLLTIRNEVGTLIVKKQFENFDYVNLSKYKTGYYTLLVKNGTFMSSKIFEKK